MAAEPGENRTWANQTAQHRGRLLRYWFPNPDRAPLANDLEALSFNTGEYAIVGGNTYFGGSLDAGQYPNRERFKNFRDYVFLGFKNFVNNLGNDIAASITDEQLGNLGGTNVGHFGEIGYMGLNTVFSRGFSKPDELITGVAKEEKIRELKRNAILNPDTYITERDADLKAIDDKSLVVFNESLKKYRDEYKYPDAEAVNMANEDRKVYSNLLKKQHNLIFKTKYDATATKHYVKTT